MYTNPVAPGSGAAVQRGTIISARRLSAARGAHNAARSQGAAVQRASRTAGGHGGAITAAGGDFTSVGPAQSEAPLPASKTKRIGASATD